MKKEITLGQLIAVGASLLIAIITGWVTINNKVSTHDAEIKHLQDRYDKSERTFERIESKVEQILINLEKKKDK